MMSGFHTTGVVTFLFLAGAAVPARATIGDGEELRGKARSILAENCFGCHGPDASARKAKLRLDLRQQLFGERDGARIVAPGAPEESELIARVTAADPDKRMPPAKSGKKLTGAQVELLREWIRAGAPWGRHWAFVPPRRPEAPDVPDPSWKRNPIDAFVRAKLDARGLAPSRQADRVTLLRRLHLDLLGLPPTTEDVDRFVEECGREGVPHDVYAKWVDRLLASAHFGERWGRHWLDLARYADSDGYEDDRSRPDAWRFRDWVISAVNRDLPFDRFTVEQLAGDLLPDAGYDQKVAAGFHRMATFNRVAVGRENEEEFRVKSVKERVNTTAIVWLGLTLGCAECHDHKYDPLSQRDYYRVYAFFNSQEDAKIPAPPLPERYTRAYRRAMKEYEKARRAGNSQGLANNKPEPPSTKALSLTDRSRKRRTFVQVRGNFRDPGEEVRSAIPKCLPSPKGGVPTRLDLARWIADAGNPLTSRVAVNHVWKHLFGRGLVGTPENFGAQGERPSHPGLLDWLAVEFVREGWSRKRLIKRIVTSATYRQSSRARPDAARIDPENRLLSRQNRFRVEAEVVRDLALAVSGLLNSDLGGPSVQPPLPASLVNRPELRSERLMMPSDGLDRYRRGVYVNVQRTFPYPMLKDFDAADSNRSCPRRDRSITAQQALTLLNDPVFAECARAIGLRIVRECRGNPEERATHAFRLCLARPPDREERKAIVDVYQAHLALYRKNPRLAADLLGGAPLPAGTALEEAAAWAAVGRILLNVEEFITRD